MPQSRGSTDPVIAAPAPVTSSSSGGGSSGSSSASASTAGLPPITASSNYLNALFLEWLSLPDTEWFLHQTIEEIKHEAIAHAASAAAAGGSGGASSLTTDHPPSSMLSLRTGTGGVGGVGLTVSTPSPGSPDRSNERGFRHLTVNALAASPHSPRSPPPPRSPRSPLHLSSALLAAAAHNAATAAAAAAAAGGSSSSSNSNSSANNTSPPPSPPSPKSPRIDRTGAGGADHTSLPPVTLFTSPTSTHPSLLPGASGTGGVSDSPPGSKPQPIQFGSPDKSGSPPHGSQPAIVESGSPPNTKYSHLNVDIKHDDHHSTSGSRPSPPRSPNAASRHERSNSGGSHSPSGKPTLATRHSVPGGATGPNGTSSLDTSHTIQPFYFPDGQPLSPTSRQRELTQLDEIFTKAPNGLVLDEFFNVTTAVCGLSSYCNSCLFDRVYAFAAANDPTSAAAIALRAALAHAEADSKTAADAKANAAAAATATANGDKKADAPAAAAAAAAATAPKKDEPPKIVTRKMFEDFWNTEFSRADRFTRLYRLLRNPKNNHLVRDDFRPIVQEIVNRHPGLEFLETTPEFQLRYAQTVIARIFYQVNRSGTEKLTLRELRRSNFVMMLALLDEEDDINKINDYFSYEHFYVIYCKFWELDTDHDFLLDTNDLLRYDNFSLTTRIVERIMAGVPRRLLSQVPGKLCYEDFVIFLISEVDKTSEVSHEYWFRAVDLDGDGIIAQYEIEYFFQEQSSRMQGLSQEIVRFEDILCQLTDMIKPVTENLFLRGDLRHSLMAPLFYNILFNLSKFIQAEQRDPIKIKQVHSTPQLTDWDRYAIAGYYRLAECEQDQNSEQQHQDFNVDVQVPVDLEAWDQNDFDTFDKTDAKSAALVNANANKQAATHSGGAAGAAAAAAAAAGSKPATGAVTATGAKPADAKTGGTGGSSPDSEDDLLDPSVVSAVAAEPDDDEDSTPAAAATTPAPAAAAAATATVKK